MRVAAIHPIADPVDARAPDTAFSRLDTIGVIKHLAPHESLALEGDTADRLHRVLSGTVAGYKATADGRRQILAFFFPGDLVGLTVGERYAYSAEAVDHASVRSVPHARLRGTRGANAGAAGKSAFGSAPGGCGGAGKASLARTQDGAGATGRLPPGMRRPHRAARKGWAPLRPIVDEPARDRRLSGPRLRDGKPDSRRAGARRRHRHRAALRRRHHPQPSPSRRGGGRGRATRQRTVLNSGSAPGDARRLGLRPAE